MHKVYMYIRLYVIVYSIIGFEEGKIEGKAGTNKSI